MLKRIAFVAPLVLSVVAACGRDRVAQSKPSKERAATTTPPSAPAAADESWERLAGLQAEELERLRAENAELRRRLATAESPVPFSPPPAQTAPAEGGPRLEERIGPGEGDANLFERRRTPRTPSAAQPVREAPRLPDLRMVGVSSSPTESNSSWTRYAWQLTVANVEAVAVTFDAELQWLDGRGFVVDSAREWGLRLGPGAQQTFTGSKLITAEIAPNVVSIKADLRLR